MSTESAFVTAPQDNVLELPAVMVEGEAANDAMFGVPEQPLGGAVVAVAVGVGGEGGGAVGGTSIVTSTVVPNSVPEGLFMRQ